MILARIVGFDYGERRVGMAVSDPLGLTAQPHHVIDLADGPLADLLPPLLAGLEAERIVVGLPLSLSGEEGPSARAARRFGEEAAEITGLPVQFFDERFTSVSAERALLESGMRRRQRRSVRDKVAAAVMLQAYLDQQG